MCVNDVCVIKLIGWKMDGWIGLSGCGKWMESGCGKWKVARFRISHSFMGARTGRIAKPPDTRSRNRRHNFDGTFRRQFFVPMHDFWISGFLEPVSGGCV